MHVILVTSRSHMEDPSLGLTATGVTNCFMYRAQGIDWVKSSLRAYYGLHCMANSGEKRSEGRLTVTQKAAH